MTGNMTGNMMSYQLHFDYREEISKTRYFDISNWENYKRFL